jgi:hypothetical protein
MVILLVAYLVNYPPLETVGFLRGVEYAYVTPISSI